MPSFQAPNNLPSYKFTWDSNISKGRMKRNYPRSFKAAPMDVGNAYLSRNTSSYRKRQKSSYRSTPYSGPYRMLTMGSRHTNPVYPRPEVKYWDINQAGVPFVAPATNSGTAMPFAGTAFCLNRIIPGEASNQRVGARVSTKSVSFRFEVDLPVTTSTPVAGIPVQCSGRVVLVWDKQPNAAIATWSGVFQYASYLSYMDIGNAQRFTILRNQQFSLSPQGDQTLFFDGYVKINMDTIFPAASVNGAPTTGALLLMYISDQTAAASQPLIQGCWRVRYLDA